MDGARLRFSQPAATPEQARAAPGARLLDHGRMRVSRPKPECEVDPMHIFRPRVPFTLPLTLSRKPATLPRTPARRPLESGGLVAAIHTTHATTCRGARAWR
ncbi:protein of unknown function [Sterolibacterium denitrificans]|uniref:Uncharacterized protein n=1 Tax=Sterolibacterium denitrificans TaxID=157592 RepID=A0A7Z7HTL5_9PROT|nr:protein of unknown function [Sterolibacterium denitrificans]